MRLDTVIYVSAAGWGYVATVEYSGSLRWWGGLISAMLIAWKAKRSPGKGEGVQNARTDSNGTT